MRNVVNLLAVLLIVSCGSPDIGELELASHTQHCRSRGPDYCSGLPNATHCHIDNSSNSGACHDGRCLTLQPGEKTHDADGDDRECPPKTDASMPDSGGSAGTGGSSGTGGVGGNAGTGGDAGSAGNTGGSNAGSGGNAGTGSVGGSAGIGGSGGVGGSAGSGDSGGSSGTGGTAGGNNLDAGTTITDSGQTMGTGGGDGAVVPSPPTTDAQPSPPSSIEPSPPTNSGNANGKPVTQGNNESLGRIGWGCTMGGPSTGTNLWLLGFLVLLFIFALYRRSRLGIYLAAIAFALLVVSIANAETTLPLVRANVDGVLQANPLDLQLSGTHNVRLGAEVGLEFPLNYHFDLGMKFSIGEYPGASFVGVVHTDRSVRALNPFFELRGIVHPAGGDAGLGTGGWLGATYELGPGRLEAGPAVEFYTSPDNGQFRNYAVLGIIGYQFDLSNGHKAKPAPAPTPAPTPPLFAERRLAQPASPAPTPPCEKAEPQPAPAPAPKYQMISVDAQVLFAFDSDTIRPEARHILNTAIAKVPENVEVWVIGHTDSTGKAWYNMDLSKRRAIAVAKYMFKARADLVIYADGLGESKPRADNKTREGRRKNRRVEIFFKSEE